MAGAAAVAALSGHGRYVSEIRELLHALHRAGHALKEAGEEWTKDEDEK